ncbi:MAG: hypothetical protein HC769_35575 [Cyanobacteria bacterium CRU_2_1]|nr:hypothetical protein [Cyanobacteria bacterium CRU_2_1]
MVRQRPKWHIRLPFGKSLHQPIGGVDRPSDFRRQSSIPGTMPIREGKGDPIRGTPSSSFSATPEVTIEEPPSSSEPDSSNFGPPNPSPQPGKPWRWTLMWLAALAILSGMGTAALLWLVSLPPPPDCKQPTLDMERLYCAQQAVQSGELPELIAGLNLVKQWTPEHPMYAEAKKLKEEWSKQILAIAREKVRASDLKGAMELIRHIPESTPAYEEAQAAVAEWQKQWSQGEEIYAKVQDAMKNQNWNLASEQIAVMAELENPYWNARRANDLAQQLNIERRARQTLTQAQKLAEMGSPEQLSEAIAIVEQLPDGSYAMADAKANRKQWSQLLVSQAIDLWQQGNTERASAILQVSAKITPAPELQDLILFGNAYGQASTISSRWLPSLEQIWKLMEAIAAIQQVQPESQFYTQAQIHKSNWQSQLKDSIQLEYANLFASLGQRSTFELAIAQAQQIAPDRPRRLQAQTLISFWFDEIERLEDEPRLRYAQSLAQSGQIPDLQAAITEASKIPQSRSLRLEAQSWIATWRNQIQVVEDQPYLDRAYVLAQQGDLNGAIDAANAIRPERALYAEAQYAIDGWQSELIRTSQVAHDRPLLNQAHSLAESGNLSEAIQVASQISSGRALYGEAQSSIARWRDQLNPPRRSDLEDGDSEPDLPDFATPSPDSPQPSDKPSSSDGATPPNEGQPFDSNGAPAPVIESVPAPPELLDEPSPPLIEELPQSSPEAIDEPSPPEPSDSYEGFYDERYYQDSE